MPMSLSERVHRNIPQLMMNVVFTRLMVLIWGRATGKTMGAASDFAYRNWTSMPRSNGALYANTYTDVLTKLLPAIIQGWERYGFTEGVHFFVGKYASSSWHWPKAYRHPRGDAVRHYIHCVNGSGIFLVSGDRSTSNGFSLDWAIIEEARLQRVDRLKEFLLTIRGNAEHFSHLSNHGSILYVSDMPRTASEKWLLSFRDQMDSKLIEAIIALYAFIDKMEKELQGAPPDTRFRLQKKITLYSSKLTILRKKAVYFSTASTFDNIHALGIDPIQNFRRQLSDYEFLLSVCNEEIKSVQNSFYPRLSEEHHGYYSENYSRIDTLDISSKNAQHRDCTWHSDIDPYSPMDISCDYNNAINSVVTGQPIGDEYRVVSSMYVLAPDYLRELAQRWCDYFAAHPCKRVNYYYDNTAIGGNAKGDISFAMEWVKILQARGWQVTQHYIGQSPRHHDRYLLWQLTLAERDSRLLRYRFNRQTAAQLFTSMSTAGAKRERDAYKKDKSSERQGSGIAPQDATHLSEAADILLYAVQRPRISDLGSFIDIVAG